MPQTANRRLHTRYAAGIDCKMLRGSASRYDFARTADVSAGGAALDVRTARPVRVGEDITIAMNWGHLPLLRSGDMVTARVLRAGPLLDNAQRVAIRFNRPQHAADALAAPEAA